MFKRFLFAVLLFLAIVPMPSVYERWLYFQAGRSTLMLSPIFNLNRGGTGFQVDTPEGPRVVTNAHVCGYQPALLARSMWDARMTDVLLVKKVDRDADLCLLEAMPGLRALSLAWFKPHILDEIFVVGHPALELTTISRGRVRGDLDVQLAYPLKPEDCAPPSEVLGPFCLKFVKATSISAKVYGGNSGSPVVNSFGQVVGVLFAGSGITDNGYFVPLEVLEKFLRE